MGKTTFHISSFHFKENFYRQSKQKVSTSFLAFFISWLHPFDSTEVSDAASPSQQHPSCWLKRWSSWKMLMKEKCCGRGCFRKSFLPSNDIRILNHQQKTMPMQWCGWQTFKEHSLSLTSFLLINWKIRKGEYQTHLLIIKGKKSPFW